MALVLVNSKKWVGALAKPALAAINIFPLGSIAAGALARSTARRAIWPTDHRKIGACDPGIAGRRVDRGWVCRRRGATGVATEGDHGAVGARYCGPCRIVTASRGIDERARACWRCWSIVPFQDRTAGRPADSNVDRQHLATLQERVALSVLLSYLGAPVLFQPKVVALSRASSAGFAQLAPSM